MLIPQLSVIHKMVPTPITTPIPTPVPTATPMPMSPSPMDMPAMDQPAHTHESMTGMSVPAAHGHAMAQGDTTPLFAVDIIILAFGIMIITAVRHTSFGARMGKRLHLINAGFMAICLNHFLDTLWIHPSFGGQVILGSSAADVVHHAGNLVGFALIFLGFFYASRANKREQPVQQ